MTDEVVNDYTGGVVYEGLKGVRYKVGMYLGSTGVTSDRHAPRALTHMAQEVISNARDEILAGYGDVIAVKIHADGSMSVSDHGRGFPKGPRDSFSEVVKMLTQTHSSGKFGDKNYTVSGVAGLHGIGLKAVNAVSEWLTVTAVSWKTDTDNDGNDYLCGGKERYTITFNQEKVADCQHEDVEDDVQTGTTIHFMPDRGQLGDDNPKPVFESTVWTTNDLEPMLESSSFLMPKTRVSLIDERGERVEKEWFYENGLTDYVSSLVGGQPTVSGMKSPVFFEDVANVDGYDVSMSCAVAFTEDASGSVLSYANGVPTREGGPHEDGFRKAVLEVMNELVDRFGHKHKKKSELSKITLNPRDIESGLTCAFEVRVPGDIASFEGQTKEKLGTTQSRKAAHDITRAGLLGWFTDNPEAAEEIIGNVIDAADARIKVAKEKVDAKAARKLKKGGSLVTSTKLKEASSRNPRDRELYIVEGDSASSIGRNPRTQAVFPIRGKIRNVSGLRLSDALKNVEIATIVKVLGAGVGSEFDVSKIRYDKIIIAADADPDGGHIRMLLFTMFLHLMPELIEDGHLYILVPPLYKAEKFVDGEQKLVVAHTDAEMKTLMPKLDGYDISRYKGLGQMDTDERKRYLADPEHRVIKRVDIDDIASVKRNNRILMGDNADLRKTWVSEHVDFSAKSE